MLKKVLLGVLCLSLFSGDVDALSKRQKNVIKLVGLGALGALVTYGTFVVRLALIKRSKGYERIVYCHCKEGNKTDQLCLLNSTCVQCDFEKNKSCTNLPKAHKKGTGFESWKNALDSNLIFIKTPSKCSYEPLAVYSYKHGINRDPKTYDAKTIYDWVVKQEKNPLTWAIIKNAFISPCEVFYHGKRDVANGLSKLASLCSKSKKPAGEYAGGGEGCEEA